MGTALLRFLLISASSLVWAVAGADETADQAACVEADPVPMPEDERQRITLSLLERYPELASSPGVKAASTSPGCPGVSEATSVIYYPHTENHGIKEAFEALCGRTYPEKNWSCDDVRIRRYLRLASQEFEVRVTASEITSDTALALIEATRRDLQALTNASDRPDTAIIIMPHHDLGITWSRTPEGVLTALGAPPDLDDLEVIGYRVTWGTPEGRSRLTLLATLSEGGDPDNPDDWHASLFRSPRQE